ncbi:MAG TPA: hypothetical protein DCP68_03895 [Ruminococcus sp.]|nr:hypothetical protein [Ruminococcus sp.]
MKNDFDVFISYRRDGGIHLARLLHDKLEQRGFRLFLDMENMRAGKFNEQLFTYIENCPSFLLVLPPGALDRCVNEEDWLRREIRHALNTRKNIVVVKDSEFEDYPENLPNDIAEIRHYQSARVSEEYFDAFVDRVANYLRQGRENAGIPQTAPKAIPLIQLKKMPQTVPAKAALTAPQTRPAASVQPMQPAAEKRKTVLPPGTETVNVPAGKEKVGGGAYACDPKIGTVVLPEGIKEIGMAAFADCTGLTAVKLPQSLTYIRSGAFAGCRNLQEIRFPDGLKEIGAAAFAGCVSLSSITLPAAKIREGAFADCYRLENAVIPENAEILPDAFAGCCKLKDPVKQTEIKE